MNRTDAPTSTQYAAPVLHDDPNLRVVDHETRGNKQSAEEDIEDGANEERVAFHAQPTRQTDELLIEEPSDGRTQIATSK